MLVGADVLVAKEDHEIFGKRPMDFIHLTVGARIVRDELPDVDAGNLGADDRREFLDADGLVARLRRRCDDNAGLVCRTASSWAFSQPFLIGIIVAKAMPSATYRCRSGLEPGPIATETDFTERYRPACWSR